MANTHAVKDPKNGVVSCWVCTGAMFLFDIMRRTMLRMDKPVIDWVFIILEVIWVVISVYQTVKYVKQKNKKEQGK